MITFDETTFDSVPDFFSITREPLPDLPDPTAVTDGDFFLHEGDFHWVNPKFVLDFWGTPTSPTTVLCSASRCCLKVEHPIRFCPIHDHLNGPDPEWVSGTVHPTGGYDKVQAEEFRSGVNYLLGGRHHRLDGPARVGLDGREWWVDGRLHRLDGPAIEGLGVPDARRIAYARTSNHYVYGHPVHERHLASVVEALDSGAPLEWALAYASAAAE